MKKNRSLITGGAGFIGSAVIRYIITHTEHSVLNLDKILIINILIILAIKKSINSEFTELILSLKQYCQTIICQKRP